MALEGMVRDRGRLMYTVPLINPSTVPACRDIVSDFLDSPPVRRRDMADALREASGALEELARQGDISAIQNAGSMVTGLIGMAEEEGQRDFWFGEQIVYVVEGIREEPELVLYVGPPSTNFMFGNLREVDESPVMLPYDMQGLYHPTPEEAAAVVASVESGDGVRINLSEEFRDSYEFGRATAALSLSIDLEEGVMLNEALGVDARAAVDISPSVRGLMDYMIGRKNVGRMPHSKYASAESRVYGQTIGLINPGSIMTRNGPRRDSTIKMLGHGDVVAAFGSVSFDKQGCFRLTMCHTDLDSSKYVLVGMPK